MFSSAPERARPWWAWGCAALCLSSLIALGALSAVARASLEARRESARARVLALREAAALPRRPLWGEARDEENAALDYNGFQWVMSLPVGRSGRRYLEGWEERPPALPDDVEGVMVEIGLGGPFDLRALRGIEKQLWPAWREAPDPRLVRSYERFRPALRYLRKGVTRGRCDWQTPWEEGWQPKDPFSFYRAGAYLLAFEASRQPPREALETGFVILSVADDLDRQGTAMGSMFALVLRSIGYRSLVQTLSRRGLGPQDCRRVLDLLSRQTWRRPEELYELQRLAAEVEVLRLADRPLGLAPARIGPSPPRLELRPGLRLLAGIWVLQERELQRCLALVDEAEAIGREGPEGLQGFRRLETAKSQSQLLFLSPDLVDMSVAWEIQRVRVYSELTRAVAAAQRLRLAEGDFPREIEALGPILGRVPLDPMAPERTLGYRRDGSLLLIYSVGPNGEDEDGRGDDLLTITCRPQPE